MIKMALSGCLFVVRHPDIVSAWPTVSNRSFDTLHGIFAEDFYAEKTIRIGVGWSQWTK